MSPVVQRFGTFGEDFDVLAVGVDPIALPAGNFLDDAQALQCVYGARGRWKCDICASSEILDACKRTTAEFIENPQGIRCSSAQCPDRAGIRLEQVAQAVGGVHGTGRGFGYAFEEEVQPGFPVAFGSAPVEQAVILGSVLLEEEAEVEQWLGKDALGVQDQRNEKPSNTAVAVQERVNRFELDVGKCGLDQRRA